MFGGGIVKASTGSVVLTNCTFSGNTAPSGNGGGIANANPGTISVRSTIFANSGTGGNCRFTITDDGFNISDDSTCGFSGTSVNMTDPMLDPDGLEANGGPTKTIALLGNSPAIDKIPVAQCVDQSANPVTTDQRGFARPDPSETITAESSCDIGAFESGPDDIGAGGNSVTHRVIAIVGVVALAISASSSARAQNCQAKLFDTAWNCSVNCSGGFSASNVCFEFGDFSISQHFDMCEAVEGVGGCACTDSGSATAPKFDSSSSSFECTGSNFTGLYMGKVSGKHLSAQSEYTSGESCILTCTKEAFPCGC